MSTTEAAYVGPPAKRRILDGFPPPSGTVYPPHLPQPDSYNKIIIAPVVQSESPDAPTFLFNFKTHYNQFIRFPSDCFIVLYDAVMSNDKYVERAAGVAFDESNPRHHKEVFVDPANNSPPYYFPSLLGGRALLGNIEAVIDGSIIPESALGSDPHYTVLNRKYCSDAVRRESYGDQLFWASSCKEVEYSDAVEAIESLPARPGFAAASLNLPQDNADVLGDWTAPQIDATPYQPAKPVYRHKTLEKLQRSLTFDGKFKSVPNMLSCGFDSFFPVGGQSNILRQLHKLKIDNYYFKKNTDFSFVVHKRNPLTSLLERADVTDAQYFSGNALPAPKDVKIRIKTVYLVDESFICYENEKIMRPLLTQRFECDLAGYRQKHLKHDSIVDSINFAIPAGTNFLMVVFLHQNQIAYGSTANSFISCTRYTCVPDLDEMEMSFPGKENMLFHRGLRGLGNYGGRCEPSMKIYHEDLIKRNLYTRSFDHFVPRKTDGVTKAPLGYDFALIASTETCPLKAMTDLQINLKYKESSPKHWFIRCYFSHQRRFSYDDSTRWTWTDVIPK